jgi:hypothetical protein
LAIKKTEPTPTPTPTPVEPTTDPFAAKPKTKVNLNDPFAAGSTYGKTKKAAEPELNLIEKIVVGATRKAAGDAKNIASVGKAVLDPLLTTSRYSAGSAVEGAKVDKYRQKLVDDATKGKTGIEKGKALVAVMNSPEYRFLKGTDFNPFEAGIENVKAGNRGDYTKSYIDVLETSAPNTDWSKVGVVDTFLGKLSLPALAGDILTDPLTFTPAGTFAIPARGLVTGTRLAAKGAAAAAKGAPSTRYALQNLKPAAAKKVTANATPNKPGYSVFEQVSRKPVIKENLKAPVGPLADKLAKTDELLRTKFTYTTSPGVPNLMKTIGSGLEAGYKGAANRIVLDVTKRSLQKIARQEGSQSVLVTAAKLVDNAGQEVDLQPLTPYTANGKTFVLENLPDGKTQLSTFKNEENAIEFVNSLTKKPKGSKVNVVKAPKGSKVTQTLEPVIDSAPLPRTEIPTVAPAVKTVPVDAKKLIKDVERIAKGVKGTGSGTGLIESISSIVNRADGTVRVPPLMAKTLEQVVKNGADAFTAIRNLAGPQENREVLSIINNRVIVAPSGKKYKIGELLQGKILWNTLNPAIKQQIIDVMAGLMKPAGQAAKEKFDEITAIAGEAFAKDMKKTGILEGKDVPKSVLNAVLAKLPKAGERAYNNFDELIQGLKSGDVVDFKVVEKLAKLIDPVNAQALKVGKALTKEDAYLQFKEILVQKGPQTMADTQRSIDILDATEFMKVEGLAFSDVMGKYTQDRLSGELPPMASAVPESRGAATLRVANWSKTEAAKLLDKALAAINEGFAGQFEYIAQKIATSADVMEGVSKLGDLAIRSTSEEFVEGSTAALRNVVTQNTEARIHSYLLGRIRYNLSTKGKKKGSRVDVDPNLIMDEFLQAGPMVDTSLLATTGARITYNKAAAIAKGEKHFVYSSISSIAKIFNETGGRKIFIEAIIPNTKKLGIQKTDALSFVAVGNATRFVLEQVERGVAINVSDVVAILRTRGEQQTAWSAEFKATFESVSSRFAKHLTDPKVIEKLQAVHASRAAATVEDNLSAAANLSQNVLEIMEKGWKANTAKGTMSDAAQAQLVRDYFNQFSYVSGIFREQTGEIGEAVFKAASMVFLRNGRLAKEGVTGTGAPLLGSVRRGASEEDQAMWKDMMDGINRFYHYAGGDNTPNVKLGTVAKPAEPQIAKATKALTGAQLAFETHVAARLTMTTKAQLAQWSTELAVFRKNLEKTRANANKLGIPTFHWQEGEWVPSHLYDHALALEKAREATDLIATETGFVKAEVVDTPNLFPGQKIVKGKQAEALINAWREENITKSLDSMVGLQEEAAVGALNKIGEFIDGATDTVEAAYRAYHETILGPYDKTQIRVHLGATDYTALKNAPKEGEVRPSAVGRGGARVSGTSGRWNTRPLLTRAESTLLNQIASLADAATHIRSKWMKLDVTQNEIAKSFEYAAARIDPPARTSARIVALTADLRHLLDPIFGNPETSAIVANHLPPAALQAAFKKYGLTESIGFVAPDQLLTPKQLAEYTAWLPFAKLPDAAAAARKLGDNTAYDMWKKRQKDFEKSGADPFMMITRLAQAVQFAVTEHTFVTDFASRFSAAAAGLTPKQAMEMGWVQIKGNSVGGTNLTEYLPSPEKGGLFPPAIADEFLSLSREWNKLFNDKKLPQYIGVMMEIVGAFKASQTVGVILPNPRHHIVNAIGEGSTVLLKGIVNPVLWGHGVRLAAKIVTDDVRGILKSTKVDQKLLRSMNNIEEPNRAFEAVSKEGTKGIPVKLRDKKTGKVVMVFLDDELLLTRARNRGVSIGNTQADDIQGLSEAVTARSLSGVRGQIDDKVLDLLKASVVGEEGAAKQLGAKVLANTRQGVQATIKPYGTLASWYTNVFRLTHMSDVITKRTWNSVEEALDAASDEVARYHPTITSLSAAERVGPRLIIGYYTWIRVSHNALIDMAANYTQSMLLFPRIQENIATQEGLDPASVSNPWSPESLVPEYMRSWVYGPTEKTEQGDKVYKRSIQTMDVLDFWSIWNQPWKDPFANAVNAGEGIARILGKNLNPVLQPIAESLSGTDLQTGAPKNLESPESVIEDFLSNIGLAQAAKGYGYSPGDKELTPEQRDQILRNFYTGEKGTFVETPANQKNARRELGDRMRYLWEQKAKEKKDK